MRIRRSKVNPCRAQKPKKYFCFFILLFLGKLNILKTTSLFAYLIKGTALGQALWGANTFPTRNRLPNPNFGFRRPCLFFMVFSIVFQNKLWWRLQISLFLNSFFLFWIVVVPSRFSGCDNAQNLQKFMYCIILRSS